MLIADGFGAMFGSQLHSINDTGMNQFIRQNHRFVITNGR